MRAAPPVLTVMESPLADARKALFAANSLAGRSVPARLWHVPELIPGRTVTLLAGDGAVGKSTLALQLGLATALGRPWLGRMPRRGPVIYLSSEDDADELHRRAHDAAIFYDAGLEDLHALHMWPLADQETLLGAARNGDPIESTPLYEELADAADGLEPVLLILDSLADVFGGEENSRPHARQFIGLLRRLAIKHELAVVLLSHPSLSGLQSGSGMSGSTAWNNSVRSRLYLEQPSAGADERDPDIRTLSLKKANYTRSIPDICLRRRIGGYAVEGGEAPASLDRAAAQAKVDQTFLELVASYSAQGRPVSARPGPNYAPALFAKDASAKGASRTGLQAAMNRLMGAAKLREEEIGPASRRRHRLVQVSNEGAG